MSDRVSRMRDVRRGDARALAVLMASFDAPDTFRSRIAMEGTRWETVEPELPVGPMGLCYSNAAKAVLRLGEEYAYCQGYATHPGVGVPLEHAWVLRREDDKAFCATWADGMADHHGLALTHREFLSMMELTLRTGLWGIAFHRSWPSVDSSVKHRE